jgi:hypothetical protein
LLGALPRSFCYPRTLALGGGVAPAVSAPNGKFSVEGGQYDGDGSAIALGSYTLPLGPSLGLQADGALGIIDGDVMGGGGVHLFTRRPSSYLLGVYASYHTWDSIAIWRTAAEFQLYLNRFSLDGLAGYESIDFLNADDDHFFTQLDLGYYLINDLKLYGGYRYINETSLGGVGVEYLLRDVGAPVSLFAKADFGDEQYNRVAGGLKVYFGENPGRSLIERHRTEDPDNYTPMFPTLKTQRSQASPGALPQCTINGDYVVDSPANGQCTCPSGTLNAGGAPSPLGGGFYSCGNPH